MKKNLKLYLILLLILSSFCLFSCSSSNGSGGDDDTSVNTSSDNSQDQSNENNEDSQTEPSQSNTERIDVSGLPEVISTLEKDDGDKLVLVNKLYTVSPDYQPTDMVAVDGSLSTNQGLYFKKEAYEAYLKMLEDAKSEGIEFVICSTYRSYSTQDTIYHNYVSMALIMPIRFQPIRAEASIIQDGPWTLLPLQWDMI